MKRLYFILTIAAGLIITGCGSNESGHSHGEGSGHTHAENTEQHASHEQTESAHEHEGNESDGHSHDSEESSAGHTHNGHEEGHSHANEDQHSDAHSHEHEKSGNHLAPGESYDEVRKGIRLTMAYDAESKVFTGQVENSTQDALPPVSVSVQLSNGTTLGPTNPITLKPGGSQSISLEATGEKFDHWRPHSELGSGGHSHGGSDDHQH